MAETVLLITNDQLMARKVREACSRLEIELACVEQLCEAADFVTGGRADVILCDYAAFQEIRSTSPRACVLLYTAPAESEHAIEAIKRGAIDYLVTPIDTKTLVQHIREALRVSRDIHVPAVYEVPTEDAAGERIIGQSPAMREVYKRIGLIAPREVNVLITGESGTGKELIARAILHHSPRKDRPFLAVNCAAIPETLLESELFGHERGAFTGASVRRIGKFEQCDCGTLFLDEIGDIPPATQAKLLRVLQDGAFQRLGGTAVINSDVRILAATNQPLEELIAQGRFRRDLYYRLKVATIEMPPLRQREIDVLLLAHQFVRRFNRTFGTKIRSFSPDALPALLQYPWPGNVRELENAIKSALVVARGSVMRLEFLPEHIRKGAVSASAPRVLKGDNHQGLDARAVADHLADQASLKGQLHATAIALIEREIIRAGLQRTGGRIAPAAKLLGISRNTLRKRMTHYGIRTTTSVEIRKAHE